MSLLERSAVGMAIVGDDLVVVRARVRAVSIGPRVRAVWESRRLAGFFGEGAPAGAPGFETGTPRTLALPLDSMLRREVDAGAQSADDLREVVRENLSAFVPAPEGQAALWDVAPIGAEGRSRVFVGAVSGEAIDARLARLESAGLAPTRIVPSALAWLLPRLVRDGAPAPEVFEATPTGWSLHKFDGLAWRGSRSGSGPAPAGLAEGVADRGGIVEAWGAAHDASDAADAAPRDPRGAEAVALGAALLVLWPGLDPKTAPAPAFNLLGERARRSRGVSRFVRWAGVAALAVIGSILFAEARRDRAATELASLQSVARDGKERVDKVERIRAGNERVLSAHDRLRKYETSYVARAGVLADLSGAIPANTWVERVEITDDWVHVDVVSKGATELLEAIEKSPAFEQARQSTPGVATDNAGETKFRVEARLTRTGPAISPAAPPATGGGA